MNPLLSMDSTDNDVTRCGEQAAVDDPAPVRRRARRNQEKVSRVNHAHCQQTSNAPPFVPCVSRRQFIKIGRPGYKVTKVRDAQTARLGLLFQVMLPEIKEGERPRKRFMSSFEQRKEIVNRSIQYLLVSTAIEIGALLRSQIANTELNGIWIVNRSPLNLMRRSPLPSLRKSLLPKKRIRIPSGRTGTLIQRQVPVHLVIRSWPTRSLLIRFARYVCRCSRASFCSDEMSLFVYGPRCWPMLYV